MLPYLLRLFSNYTLCALLDALGYPQVKLQTPCAPALRAEWCPARVPISLPGPLGTAGQKEIQIPSSEQMPSTMAAFTVEATAVKTTNGAAPRKLPCWFQILFSAMRMQRQPPLPTYGNDTSIPIIFLTHLLSGLTL